ncbi:AzlD domain-containing protein [Streptococcus himalayensis]|uniref:Branched-chain amino acid permease n=1 Tax=Streptococcus himalayensis TaxID=1888195 RepID=A0A917EF34_9STRE|nr:AzlD domain-containing protein [Streptococcus himalayensis]GGE34796.1 branched-chain amino acid permease [Streptococcus himalayensis]
MESSYILKAIALAALVTWLPRVIPFVLVKYRGLPDLVMRFLRFLPVTIIFVLILSSLTQGSVGHFPSFKWVDIFAAIPTLYVAFRYRNLLGSVIFGVVLLALLRFLW